MKASLNRLGTLIIVMAAITAQATVDVQGVATIVVENYHEEDTYFLRTVPTDFCVGVFPSALASSITQPVTINAGYGCGGGEGPVQINAATCARVHVEEPVGGASRGRSVRIRTDLSACSDKLSQSAKFREALRNAVTNTFSASGYSPVQFLN